MKETIRYYRILTLLTCMEVGILSHEIWLWLDTNIPRLSVVGNSLVGRIEYFVI